MTLRSRLDEDLKAAMRSRETARRDTIRYLLSEVHKAEIAEQREFHGEDILRVLSRQASQRRESIEAFRIILDYLPEQLSEEQVVELVREAIEEVGAAGPQDMGKVMGRVMPEVRGKVEGRVVNEVARRLLLSRGSG